MKANVTQYQLFDLLTLGNSNFRLKLSAAENKFQGFLSFDKTQVRPFLLFFLKKVKLRPVEWATRSSKVGCSRCWVRRKFSTKSGYRFHISFFATSNVPSTKLKLNVVNSWPTFAYLKLALFELDKICKKLNMQKKIKYAKLKKLNMQN